MMRGGLISMLYDKAVDIPITDVDTASSLTLMSADIERIVTGMQTGHELWANTIEVALAIYLLERQLGVACAIPIGVAVGKWLIKTWKTQAYARSLIRRIAWCHESGHGKASSMARGYRATHASYDCNAERYAWCEDDWSDRRSARRSSTAESRGASNLKEVQEAFDMDYGNM